MGSTLTPVTMSPADVYDDSAVTAGRRVATPNPECRHSRRLDGIDRHRRSPGPQGGETRQAGRGTPALRTQRGSDGAADEPHVIALAKRPVRSQRTEFEMSRTAEADSGFPGAERLGLPGRNDAFARAVGMNQVHRVPVTALRVDGRVAIFVVMGFVGRARGEYRRGADLSPRRRFRRRCGTRRMRSCPARWPWSGAGG